MTPDEYCQNKTAQSGSSFYYSFLILPEEKKLDIIAFYAFCREIDDIVDSQTEQHIKQLKIDWWRTEIANIYNGSPQHPISHALSRAIKRYDLESKHFIALLDGMEMDLHNTQFPDYETLRLYCYRVAGVVGIVSAKIFGYTNPGTLQYAVELGIAFQLTNITRDIREDMQIKRVYIPDEDLKRFNISTEQFANLEPSEDMKQLIDFQIKRANQQYQTAFALLPSEDRYSQRTGIIMARIYQTILDKITKNKLESLQKRISLSPLRKLWIAWRTNKAECRSEAKRNKRLIKRNGK